MTTTKPLNILVSGAGIAGGAFVSCMLRANPHTRITFIERAPTLRLTGSSIDIRNTAVDIIKWMGAEPAIRAASTGELGVSFVNANGKAIATLGATGQTDVQSITSEYEIFRGKLAEIFIKPVQDQVKFVFDDYVKKYENIEGEGSKVRVTFAKRAPETYDLVVAADGLNSKIRGQMLGTKPSEQIHDEGVFVCYFTMKKDLLKGSRTAAWHNMPGGRVIFLRPDPTGLTRAHLMTVVPRGKGSEMRDRLEAALAKGHDAYKALMEDLYRDGDWLTQDVLQGMRECDDFYCSPFAQVRSPKLSDGRVVLMGDAGYATPGIGTSMAIVGGYVLAGELLTHGNDVGAAIQRYEELLMSFAKSQQGEDVAMQFLNPQTNWGIGVRDAILWSVTATKLDRLIFRAAATLGGWFDTKFKVPKYPWPAAKA